MDLISMIERAINGSMKELKLGVVIEIKETQL